MTISEANAHNAMTPNNAFMIGIGTEDNPEFIYPEELEASIARASLTESRESKAAKEASTFRNRSLVGNIGAGMDQNLGDKSLQNIAALSISVPLIATNPATAPILENATKGIVHTGKVLFDPTKAITGVGQAAATTADIYGTIEGLRQVPNATKNIVQGNGTGMDYFNLFTGLMGPFGTFNTIKGARFNPYLRQVAGYKNLSLDDGDRLLNNDLPNDDVDQIQLLNSRLSAASDTDIDRIQSSNRRERRNELHDVSDVSREQIRRNLGFNEDIDVDFDDEGTMIVSGRHGRINESGSSVTNDINELRQQDDEINAIISRNTPRFRPLFPEVYERNTIREIRDKNLLGRYIELKTGKTLSDIADNYVLVDLQPVPIDEIKTIMRNKGFNEEFINFSLRNFAESVRSAIDNPIKANNIRGFNYHKFEPDFRTGTQAFKLNKVRTNPETGIKHIFENYFGLHSFGNKIFNDTSRINAEDKEILDELISLYNNRTSSNLSFNDLNDVDKFADFRNFLRTLWSDKKFPGDINSMAWSDAEGFGEFKPFSTPSNYDAMKVLKKSEDILNELPRGYSMAEDNTSYDSEMLKLLKVIKNKDKYGRKAGQYSVESLGTSSWGNDFHKEQIRIGDILNEYRDKLSQSDIDYIESIINRNPNGKPSPELVNIIKDKYDLLGEELAKNLYKTWGRILDIDPSLNIDREIIKYEPFNERSVFSDIIRKGKVTPRIYRPDIRIHHNKLGGKHKFKLGGIKQNKVFKLKGGVAVPLDDKKRLFYLSGAKHEQGGIDVTPELEAEGGEVVKINPKSIKVVTAQKIMGGKSPAELVVDASSTGKSEKVFNKVFNYQEDFKDRHNLNDDGTKKAKFGKILNKLSNFYWHTLRAPKDYSEEVATLRNGCATTECAKWSNDQLQKAGLSIFGDAWTRSSNKGIKKIYSGYDVSKRPKQYNKEEVINYTLSAADSLAKTLDINQLKQNDIVGLYFRNSPNIETAYNKGTNGETQTHTGHVVIDEDGIPFVVHNVHGNIVKNKAEDLIGSKHPYGITSVYRKELGGQMKNKKKANLGIQETLNKFGQHYLYPSVTPAISVANDPNKKSVGEVIDEYGRHYLYQPEFEITPPIVVANKVTTPVKTINDFNSKYLWQPPASTRGDVPYPHRLEEEIIAPMEQIVEPQVQIPVQTNYKSTANTTAKTPVVQRTTPTTTTTNKTTETSVNQNINKSSQTPIQTNSNNVNKSSLNLDFLNEITNPNGSTYNLRTGQTYIKDWNKVRRTPYSSLNLKTGETEYAGFINPYGSKIKSAVYDNGPQGRQERTAEERLLNAGDWINIGSNALGAVGNLLTGLLTPNIKYARMRDSIPLIAPKINSNVNTTAEEDAINEAYNDEIRAINENTADSKTALNRKRNAAVRKRQAKVKVRSAAENISRNLRNKGNILKGEYDKFNIQRQENVDAYNKQADVAEFNANRTKVSDAITGFLSDLTGSASTITNAIERRQADKRNTVLSYLANPNVDPAKFKEGYDKVYAELYPSKTKTKNKSKKNNTQS